jgi:hypothetical protein
MISAAKVLAVICGERRRWRYRELTNDYTRGVLQGLELSAMAVRDEHERVRRAQESSPFIWKASAIRKMLKQAISYLMRCDRAKGIALIEKVLTIPKGAFKNEISNHPKA